MHCRRLRLTNQPYTPLSVIHPRRLGRLERQRLRLITPHGRHRQHVMYRNAVPQLADQTLLVRIPQRIVGVVHHLAHVVRNHIHRCLPCGDTLHRLGQMPVELHLRLEELEGGGCHEGMVRFLAYGGDGGGGVLI